MQVAFPMLEELHLGWLDSVKTLWPDDFPKVSYMQNLKRLNVRYCSSLKYLFSLPMARSFVRLEELSVEGCNIMEEVLVIEETGEAGRPNNTTILFPQLESLELCFLPNLRRFYEGDFVIVFPALRNLRMQGVCREKVEETEEPFFSEKVHFHLLSRLLIYIYMFVFVVFE